MLHDLLYRYLGDIEAAVRELEGAYIERYEKGRLEAREGVVRWAMCPICENNSSRRVFSIGPISNRFQIVQCQNCKLYYLNPQPITHS